MIKLSGSVAEVIHFLEGTESEHVLVHVEFKEVGTDKPEQTKNKPNKPENILLTADHVAERLGLTDRKHPAESVRYLHRTKQLPGVKVLGRWRWRSEDVEQFARQAGK